MTLCKHTHTHICLWWQQVKYQDIRISGFQDIRRGTGFSYHVAALLRAGSAADSVPLANVLFQLLVPPCTDQDGSWGSALTKGSVCVRAGWRWAQHTPSLVSVMHKPENSSSPSLITGLIFHLGIISRCTDQQTGLLYLKYLRFRPNKSQ